MNLTATRTGRRFVFGALYLSEGAPIGFIWWALPTVLAAQGETVGAITTFTALLVWPWALKFLWAPLVDGLRNRWWGYRAWVLAAQLVMGLTLASLTMVDLQADMQAVFWLLLAHALAATIQDVAIDGWAIRITPVAEHGRLNASMAIGKYVGRWLFGAGLLLVWDDLGKATVIASLVGCIWATAALVVMSKEERDGADGGECEPSERDGVAGVEAKPSPQRADGRRRGEAPPPADGRDAAHMSLSAGRSFADAIKQAMASKSTWLGLAIALISGAAFEAVGAVAGPMLIEHGMDTAAVGWWRTAWVGAMIAGAWLGGYASDRWGHRKSVTYWLILLAAWTGAVAAVELLGGSGVTIAAAITVLHVGIGLFIAASYALFMDLTDPRIGGTQFSAFMGATNGCEMWAGLLAGQLIASAGYAVGLTCMAGVSLLALPLLAALPDGKAAMPGGEDHPSPR